MNHKNSWCKLISPYSNIKPSEGEGEGITKVKRRIEDIYLINNLQKIFIEEKNCSTLNKTSEKWTLNK